MSLDGDARPFRVGLERDESFERHARLVVGSGDDGGLGHPFMRIQGRLNLAQLNPIASLFDHPIAPTVKAKRAGTVVDREVARAIPTPTDIVDDEGRLGQVGTAEIAQTNPRAGNPKLAGRPFGNVAAEFVNDLRFQRRADLTDREGGRAVVGNLQGDRLRGADVGLGRYL